MKPFIFLLLALCFTGCSGRTSFQRKADLEYQINKGELDDKLVGHFPDHITGKTSTVISGARLGLMLFEYYVSDEIIRTVKQKASLSSIATYSVRDSCLFIVNRFETMETYENYETVTAIDSTEANRSCYQNRYPVPNFIAIDKPVKKAPIKLNDSYIIYVIGAEAGNHFPEYKLEPNPQMPEGWKNGYSRGIAISEKEGTVIYWGIVW